MEPPPTPVEQKRPSAVKTLPADYTLYHTLDLSHWKLMLAMNLAGIVLLFVFGWLFLGAAALLHPEYFMLELQRLARMLSIGAFLLTITAVVVLHELCHALFFWWFTRERPKIGFNLMYAYAAAPGWYFPRNQFWLIGAAPLLLITIGGMLWLAAADFLTLPIVVLALTINAAGSVGDMLVIGWLLTQPADALVQDDGVQIVLYRKP